MKALKTLLLAAVLAQTGCHYSTSDYLAEHPELTDRQKALVKQHGAPKYAGWTWLIGLKDICNEAMDKHPELNWETRFFLWHQEKLPIGTPQEVVERCFNVSCSRPVMSHADAYGYQEICKDGGTYYHFSRGRLSSMTHF